MSNTIQLQEPQVDLMLQTWTGLQLERGVSSTNLASFAIVTQIPYVAGQTGYTYEDAAGAVSDWYRTVRYGPGTFGTYSPPWPVQQPPISAGDGARRSLMNCRRMLGRKLGSLQVITTSADGNTDGSTLVCRALANQIDPNRYRSWWLMPTDGVSAGEIRSLGEGAVNVSSGQVALTPPMLSQIVSGTQVELHRLLPPDEEVGPVLGLRQALNLALAELWVLDRLAVVGSGTTNIDISALGDWLDADATYALYGPTSANTTPTPFGPYAVRSDASVTSMDVVGLASGASTNLELTRPGDTYIRVGGVWQDQQQGLVNDADECLFQPQFLTEIALAYCYDALANGTVGAPQARYVALSQGQRRKANHMKSMPGALPRPTTRTYGGGVGDEWPMYGSVDRKSWFG